MLVPQATSTEVGRLGVGKAGGGKTGGGEGWGWGRLGMRLFVSLRKCKMEEDGNT